MKAERVIKSIAVVVLVGMAMEAAHAQTASNEPVVETQAASPGAGVAEAKAQLPVSDAAAAPANAESVAASQKVDSDATGALETPPAKPSILERAMTGVSVLYERVKAFVTPSDK